MKKIISVILVIGLCLPATSVMADERSIPSGGLTFTVPSGYTSYTEDEANLALSQEYGGLVDDMADMFGLGIAARAVGGIVAGTASKAVTEDDYADDLELVICDDNMQHIFKIYAAGDDYYTFDDHAYYTYRITYAPIWQSMLSGEGYSSDPNDAKMYKTQNEVRFVQLDGFSDANGCCRMAVIMENGYYDRVVFISTNETTLSDSSVTLFNDLLNSITLSVSSNLPESIRGAKKYGSILYDRVELND